MRAGGAGIAEEFLALLRARARALRHRDLEHRRRARARGAAPARLAARAARCATAWCCAVLARVDALAQAGVDLGDDARSRDGAERIAALRGLVPDALADAALEAPTRSSSGRRSRRGAERTTARVEAWLAAAEREPASRRRRTCSATSRDAPRGVFDRVGRWLGQPIRAGARSRSTAYLRRLRADAADRARVDAWRRGRVDRLDFAGGATVLGGVARRRALERDARGWRAARRAQRGRAGRRARALELFVAGRRRRRDAAARERSRALGASAGAPLTRDRWLDAAAARPRAAPSRRRDAGGTAAEPALHGLHPETARAHRPGRLAHFELERLPAPDGHLLLLRPQPQQPGDERIFVLADVRGRSARRRPRGRACTSPPSSAPSTRRTRSAAHDPRRCAIPQRRLQWNRITLVRRRRRSVLDPRCRGAAGAAPRARDAPPRPGEGRRAPARARARAAREPPRTRRVRDLRPDRQRASRSAGARRARSRSCRQPPTSARSPRRAGAAWSIRTRSSACSTGSADGGLGAAARSRRALRGIRPRPRRGAAARASASPGRPYGANESGDRLRHHHARRPTRCPRACARVLILSDPTRGMGALARPGVRPHRGRASIWPSGCALPVEWIPVSSGARIAMDSGTENLDATARVVRRIVTFTQDGRRDPPDRRRASTSARRATGIALATMLMHTRGVLIMTPRRSMVLTGRAALEASGCVSAEDEVADRRLRARDGTERPGAVLRARSGRRVPHPLRALPLHATSCRASAGPRALRDERSGDARSSPTSRTRATTTTASRRVGEIFDDEHEPGPQAPVLDARADAGADRPRRRLPRALAPLVGRRDGDRLGRAPRRACRSA